MGLPGSGKTTLASKLVPLLNAKRLNNDEVRKAANDWDFSEEARTRQAKRMADFAEKYKQEDHYVVADFISNNENIFEKMRDGNLISRILNQISMIFTPLGGDGGLFVFIGKKLI